MSEYLFRCSRGHEFKARFVDRQPVQCPQCYAHSPSKPAWEHRIDEAISSVENARAVLAEVVDTGGTGDGSGK